MPDSACVYALGAASRVLTPAGSMRLDEAAASVLPVRVWHGSDWSDEVRITRHVITGTDQGIKQSFKLSNGLSLALAFADGNASPAIGPADLMLPAQHLHNLSAGASEADVCAYLQGLAASATSVSSPASNVLNTTTYETDDVHPMYAALRRSASRERRLSSEMRRSIGCRTVIETFANQGTGSVLDNDLMVPVDHPSVHTRLAWLEGVVDTVGTSVINGGGCMKLRLDVSEGTQRTALVHLLHTLGVQPRAASDGSAALWIHGAGLALLTDQGFKPKRVDTGTVGFDPDRRPSLEVVSVGEAVPLLPGEVVYEIPTGTSPDKQVVINGALVSATPST